MKKTLNVLYWLILFAALIFVLATAGSRVQATSSPAPAYESPWTIMEPGQRIVLSHGFGTVPSTLDTWCGFHNVGVNSSYSAVPCVYWQTSCVKVEMVSNTSITLKNNCTEQMIVRVDATLFP